MNEFREGSRASPTVHRRLVSPMALRRLVSPTVRTEASKVGVKSSTHFAKNSDDGRLTARAGYLSTREAHCSRSGASFARQTSRSNRSAPPRASVRAYMCVLPRRARSRMRVCKNTSSPAIGRHAPDVAGCFARERARPDRRRASDRARRRRVVPGAGRPRARTACAGRCVRCCPAGRRARARRRRAARRRPPARRRTRTAAGSRGPA